MLTREEIKQFLPHREPMLLVDDMELDGDMAISHYHVRGDEFFLQGHFPGYCAKSWVNRRPSLSLTS